MVFSWQGFRDRYPQGAVISQLLGIHQDQFLVRVELRAEGAVLATALAADSQLEQAEDRARDRAWALLAAVPAGSSAPAAPQPTTVLPMKAAPAMPAKTTQPPPTPLKAAPSAANDDVPEEPDFEDDAPWPEEESPAALATAVATGPAARPAIFAPPSADGACAPDSNSSGAKSPGIIATSPPARFSYCHRNRSSGRDLSRRISTVAAASGSIGRDCPNGSGTTAARVDPSPRPGLSEASLRQGVSPSTQ
jgi:hypothetical protein